MIVIKSKKKVIMMNMPRKSPRRSYHQFCGLARSLDVVGERWTLLIVRNLLLGPRRYSDLLGELPGITTNLLAKRLRDMEDAGLIRKEERPPPLPAVLYRLTEDGAALEPAIMELARWGGRYMDAPRAGDAVNIGWGLLSMKRRYRGGLTRVVELRIEDRRFEMALAPDRVVVQEREAVRPELVLTATLPAFRAVFFAGGEVGPLRARGALQFDGPEAFVEEFLGAWNPLPARRPSAT